MLIFIRNQLAFIDDSLAEIIVLGLAFEIMVYDTCVCGVSEDQEICSLISPFT